MSLHTFAGNFSHDNWFRKTDWMSRCMRDNENENHLIEGNCPIYRDIRMKYDSLNSDDELTAFFTEVLARRDALDKME